MRKSRFLFLLVFTGIISIAQNTPKKVKIKAREKIYFRQVAADNDTLILKNKSDVFYFWLSDDQKSRVELRIYNATFQKIYEDSLYKLIYTPGIKYHVVYKQDWKRNFKEDKLVQFTEIDGTTELNKSRILIEFFDVIENKYLFVNGYHYKEE